MSIHDADGSLHGIGAGEGTSPDMNPFYMDILKDLVQGKTVAAFQAFPPGADEPEITLFRYHERSMPRALAAAHPSPHMRALAALASQKVARRVGATHGYEPEVV